MFLMNNVKISLQRYSEMINAPQTEIEKVIKHYKVKPISKSYYNFNDMASISTKILPALKPNKKVISYFIGKGGTGKTSNVYNMSMYLGLLGYKVLLFDLDPQCNLSTQCGLTHKGISEKENSAYTLFKKERTITDAIVAVATNVDLVSGDPRMVNLDSELGRVAGSDHILMRKFKNENILEKYDFVIADNNSSPGKASNNFLFLSDCVISSANPDAFSFDGIEPVLEVIEMASEVLGRDVDYKILINECDDKSDSRGWLKKYHKHYGEFMFESFIRSSADFPNALTKKQPFFSFASQRSNALIDYISFIDEFVEYATTENVAVATNRQAEVR